MARQLVKKDTVLFSPLLENKKETDERAKAVDLVYRATHLHSLRAPEKANGIFNPEVEFVFGFFPPVKGVEPVKQTAISIHDVMDDFHIVIEEILFEGTMKEGKIAFTTTLKGIWVSSIGGVNPPQEKCEVKWNSFLILEVKNEKISRIRAINSLSDVPQWDAAWTKVWKV